RVRPADEKRARRDGAKLKQVRAVHQQEEALMRRRGITIVEVLVVCAVFGILATFIFRSFIQNKSVLEREGTDSDLQQVGRTVMQRLEQALQQAGDDPCHSYYWDNTQTSPNKYSYAAAHPWGEAVAFGGVVGLVKNPYQALVVNYDVWNKDPNNLPG